MLTSAELLKHFPDTWFLCELCRSLVEGGTVPRQGPEISSVGDKLSWTLGGDSLNGKPLSVAFHQVELA